MKGKDELEKQIQNIRETLNEKLIRDINQNTRNSIDTLQASVKLDKLIVEYMKTIENDL